MGTTEVNRPVKGWVYPSSGNATPPTTGDAIVVLATTIPSATVTATTAGIHAETNVPVWRDTYLTTNADNLDGFHPTKKGQEPPAGSGIIHSQGNDYKSVRDWNFGSLTENTVYYFKSLYVDVTGAHIFEDVRRSFGTLRAAVVPPSNGGGGTTPSPTPTPTPDPVPTTDGVTAANVFEKSLLAPVTYNGVTYDRTMYPQGTGRWSHMPHVRDWIVQGWDPAASPTLKLDDTKCYIIKVTKTRTNGVKAPEISGGLGVILSGMDYFRDESIFKSTFKVSYTSSSGPFTQPIRTGITYCGTSYDPAETSTYSNGSSKYLSMKAGPYSTTSKFSFFALEGALQRADANGDSWFWEGLNYQRQAKDQRDVLVMQNCRFDGGINMVRYANGVHHSGGDIYQPIGGPMESYVRNFTGDSYYQGFFLQMTTSQCSEVNKQLVPNLATPTVFDMRNINLTGFQHHSQIWAYKAGLKANTAFTFKNVHVGSRDGAVSKSSTIQDAGQPQANITFDVVADFAPPASKLGKDYFLGK